MLNKVIFLVCFIWVFPVFAQQSETLEEYTSYLNMVMQEEVSEKTTSEFYRRSFAFWMANKINYNNEPDKYNSTMALYHKGRDKFPRNHTIKLDRYEETIESYRRFDSRNSLPKNPILFVGSSSIVYWETAKSFPEFPIVNRGFGGASLPEVMYYYDDVIKKHNPSMMVLYSDLIAFNETHIN